MRTHPKSHPTTPASTPSSVRAKFILVVVMTAITTLSGCQQQSTADSATSQTPADAPSQGADALASNTPTAPLLEGIGPLEFPISTNVPKAQAYFNQAMTLAFGFNHAEAVRSFKEAARLDATCGICWAGAALALGPNINAPMAESAVAPAWQAVQQSLALREFENAQEQAYIDAIASRYSEDGAERQTLDLVYAGAIGGVAKRYPQDLHARTLHAEALMDLMPWEYWKDDGSPANDHTVTLVQALEDVLKQDPEHPGAAHLYIHAMERFEPAKAEAAADILGDLVPVAGHLVHMPSHIYLRLGRYGDAVDANAKAALADEDYIAQCNAQGLYPAAYYPHNIHFLWYSAMMQGRKALSIDSALKLAEKVPTEMAKQMGPLQSYLAVPAYTYVRFGMWDEALATSAPASDLPFTEAMYLYAKGIAHAARGDVAAAKSTLDDIERLASEPNLKNMTMRRPGVMEDLLGIATQLVKARIARAQADQQAELSALKQAVVHQDALPYTEPPLWHYPVRQTLGEAQLRYGVHQAAQATFTEDLEHFPHNPWSLYGLEQAHSELGSTPADLGEAVEQAWEAADIEPAISW